MCSICRLDPSTTSHALLSRQHLAEAKVLDTQKICASCSSTPVGERILCDSIDCPVTYARTAATRDVDDLNDIPSLLAELQPDNVDDDESVIEVDDTGEWSGFEVGALDW